MPRGVSALDEAQLQGRLWTPDILRPAIWLDAADISTITLVGSGVSEWRDKSGNNHHFSQTNAGNRPTYEYTAPDANSRLPITPQLGVRFNSTSTTQVLTNNTFTYAGNTLQMFTLHRNNAASGRTLYGRIFSFALNSTTNDFSTTDGMILTYGVNTNRITLFRNNAAIASPTNNINNLWVLANARRSGTTGRAAVNGGDYVTGTTAAANQNIAFSRIGNDRGAVDSGMNGWVLENMLFTRDLSDAECRIVEGYLAWKWGLIQNLSASHPYYNRPPLIGD